MLTGPDVSERLIGEALSPYKPGVVIATKGGLTRQGPGKWLPVGRAEYLTQQVEMSLRLLKEGLHRPVAAAPDRSENAGGRKPGRDEADAGRGQDPGISG